MAYCNTGPAVAAYIVEKITGQRFEDYVTQNFFVPIGMKTATYFPSTAAPSTTLYHPDGKTPYPYWNIIYRPAGAINASANDMAAYVMFYLNRGTVNGAEIMPAASIDRMEVPTRTWAAQEGLKTGYGLSNYTSILEGFVYHGHDGGVEGGLTDMAYMPDYGVGHFYSINSGNGDAFNKIGKTIRALCHARAAETGFAAGRVLARERQFVCRLVRARLAPQRSESVSRTPAGYGASPLSGRQVTPEFAGRRKSGVPPGEWRAIPDGSEERAARPGGYD